MSPRIDPFDALLDARSEARYENDPRAEPDLSEVKEGLAAMRGVETVEHERRILHG